MHSATFRRTLFTMIALTAASTASAGTLTTWSGAGSSAYWTAAGNWSTTPTASTSGTTYSLVYTGTTRPGNINNVGINTASVSVDSILFGNNNTAGKTAAFTVSGSGSRTLTLTNGATISSAATSAGTLTDVISSPVIASGTINFDLGSNHFVYFQPTAQTGSPTIVKTGAGSLALLGSAPRTYAGVTANQGTINVNSNAAAAGLAGLTVNLSTGSTAGALVYNLAATSTTTNVQFALNGNSSVGANAGVAMVFSNPNFNVATATATDSLLTLLGGSGGRQTQVIQGSIVDNVGKVSLSVTGSNTWILNGANTYTGTTSISSDSYVLFNGSNGTGTVTSRGFLGGSGTFGGAVSILSGTLSPGGTSVSGGVITPSIEKLSMATLTLSSGATVAMTVTGSTAGLYDQIAVGNTGNLNYAGTLALTLSGSYADYTDFNLFTGFATETGGWNAITLDAAGSPYAGLAFNTPSVDGVWYSTWTSDHQRLKFSESTGTLTVVPEPSTVVFAGIGMAMFGWSTWTRRRAKARRQFIEAAIA